MNFRSDPPASTSGVLGLQRGSTPCCPVYSVLAIKPKASRMLGTRVRPTRLRCPVEFLPAVARCQSSLDTLSLPPSSFCLFLFGAGSLCRAPSLSNAPGSLPLTPALDSDSLLRTQRSSLHATRAFNPQPVPQPTLTLSLYPDHPDTLPTPDPTLTLPVPPSDPDTVPPSLLSFPG